jgi:hypothetical protein
MAHWYFLFFISGYSGNPLVSKGETSCFAFLAFELHFPENKRHGHFKKKEVTMFRQAKRIGSIISAIALFSMSVSAADISQTPVNSMAQPNESLRTLCDGKLNFGGFGGPVLSFTRVKGEMGVLMGGRGACIINHHFTLGGGGYGLANFIRVQDDLTGTKRYLQMGYGGPEVGYIFYPANVANVSANVLIGGGAASRQYGVMRAQAPANSQDPAFDIFPFYVVEPAVFANLNVTRILRVSLGVKYRYVDGLEADWISNKDLRGFAGSIAVMFGKF